MRERRLEGELNRDRIPSLVAELEPLVAAREDLHLDLSLVTRIDSSGVALLSRLARRLRATGHSLHLEGANDEVRSTLALFPELGAPPRPAPPPGFLEGLGDQGASGYETGLGFLVVSADLAWFTVADLLRPYRLRFQEVLNQMYLIGSQATGVVGLISFLLGATLALQSAAQLRQFGANLYVVDLAAIALTREIGPLMAAIVVTGRSGSAISAEVGTMVVTEEVDALKTMGINPVRFLVVPKLLAMTITQPLLTVFANAAGILGAFAVATTALEVAAVPFFIRLEQALVLKDLVTGIIKSVVFAHIIVAVAAAVGFSTRGGPDAVGRSTTLSVVVGIVAVIAADAVASFIFYF